MRKTIVLHTRKTALGLLLAFLGCGFSSEISAAAGDLDQSFGIQGRRLITIPNSNPQAGPNNSEEDILVQPDGKILIAGYALDSFEGDSFTVVRFNPDGSLDSGFANGGVFRYEFDVGDDNLYGLALQTDGKIVAVGDVRLDPFGSPGNTAFALIRLNPNGTFDPTFSGDGFVVTDITASIDQLTEVALQADGRIVASGWVTTGGVNNGLAYDFAVIRYLPDGSIDPSYGTGGITVTDFNARGDLAQGSVLQPDGKLVVTGWSSTMNGDFYDIGLARYNTNGTLDQSFGVGGKVVTTVGINLQELVRGIALAPDGKLIVTGDVDDVFNQNADVDLFAVRYNANGSLDTTFDGDGRFVYNSGLGDRNERGSDVIVQPDGRTLIAGKSHLYTEQVPGGSASHTDMLLTRPNVNGSFDNSFGQGAITLTDFGIFNGPPFGTGRTGDEGQTLALQPDGKIVVAGNAKGVDDNQLGDSPDGSFNDRLVIARFENDISAPVTLPASSFVITDGNFISGGVPELAASDDTYLAVTSPASPRRASPVVQVQFETVAPEMSVGNIVFRIEANANTSPATSILQRVEMFNFTSGQWATMSESFVGSSDSVRVGTINSGASNYVQTGSRIIRSRVRWFHQGRIFTPSLNANIDHVNFTVNP